MYALKAHLRAPSFIPARSCLNYRYHPADSVLIIAGDASAKRAQVRFSPTRERSDQCGGTAARLRAPTRARTNLQRNSFARVIDRAPRAPAEAAEEPVTVPSKPIHIYHALLCVQLMFLITTDTRFLYTVTKCAYYDADFCAAEPARNILGQVSHALRPHSSGNTPARVKRLAMAHRHRRKSSFSTLGLGNSQCTRRCSHRRARVRLHCTCARVDARRCIPRHAHGSSTP